MKFGLGFRQMPFQYKSFLIKYLIVYEVRKTYDIEYVDILGL